MAALWQENRRWIAAVLLSHKPPGVDLEDLLQETAMRLVGKIDTLREEANVRAWLRAVAVNVARSAARSPHVSRTETREDLTGIEHDQADGGLGEHARRILDRVAHLADTYREPLILRAVHGMRTRQIAEALAIAPATVDTRIARARRMLREQTEAADRSQWMNQADDVRRERIS